MRQSLGAEALANDFRPGRFRSILGRSMGVVEASRQRDKTQLFLQQRIVEIAVDRLGQARIPADCTVTFKEHGGSPALSLPLDGPWLKPTLQALTDEWGREAALAGTGGSIPIVGDFKRLLNMDALMVGFARFDNRVHSPNEKYDLSSFHHGIRSWARILAALAR